MQRIMASFRLMEEREMRRKEAAQVKEEPEPPKKGAKKKAKPSKESSESAGEPVSKPRGKVCCRVRACLPPRSVAP